MIGGPAPSGAVSQIYAFPSPTAGLQTQPDKARLYAGPWDAVKKIHASNGMAGIYKGQVATLWREASGYGAYFWTYEKLMEREMTQKGIRRDQVNPGKTVLFGAASGYAVRSRS
jgi:solute carrier family 25 (mitochondrial carnitine/acylcarnitine transporter), member 20/29